MLTERQLERVRQQLRCSVVEDVFFDGRYPKMQLLSKEDIYRELGIPYADGDYFQIRGIDSVLGRVLADLRKHLHLRNLNFVSIRVSLEDGHSYVLYGFTNDVNKIDECILRWKRFYYCGRRNAERVEHAGEKQKRLLLAGQGKLLGSQR